MHSKGIAQNPLSFHRRFIVAVIMALLAIGLFWFFSGGIYKADLPLPHKKETAWVSVRVPLGVTVNIVPDGCIKERVLIIGLPWGDTWKEFKDCPGKNIALGNIGRDLHFQSLETRPVQVQVRYAFRGGQSKIQKVIAPPAG
ncbi:MAG: hypothetical protein HYT28_03055 [Parcubacteria group bacterium]|nr:hypothetical protein [Parcubacteria group bacterium]